MSVSMCQMCKDPIWSYICPHCLARNITKWLPARLKGSFRKFNEEFLGSFSMTIDLDGLRCLQCRKIRLANLCPFCYLVEVHEWLRDKNKRLARTILNSVPMGNDWVLKTGSGVIWKQGMTPITESEFRTHQEGTCETCDRYTEELVQVDGSWVCKDCHRGWQVYTSGL